MNLRKTIAALLTVAAVAIGGVTIAANTTAHTHAQATQIKWSLGY